MTGNHETRSVPGSESAHPRESAHQRPRRSGVLPGVPGVPTSFFIGEEEKNGVGDSLPPLVPSRPRRTRHTPHPAHPSWFGVSHDDVLLSLGAATCH